MLYLHDVTRNLSRENNEGNDTYKKDQQELKHFENIVFLNTFYIIFRIIYI